MEQRNRTSSSPWSAAGLLAQDEIPAYKAFVQHTRSYPNRSKRDLLFSIPGPSAGSYAPLLTLSTLLSSLPGPWPILDVQQSYTNLWKLLPEDAKSGHVSKETKQLLDDVLVQCKESYHSLIDLFNSTSAPAIIDPQTGRSISHDDLVADVYNFALPITTEWGKDKPVVAISLANGPLLATTVLATATYYTAAPIAYGSGVGAQQFKADVLQSGSSVVIASANDIARLALHETWLVDAGIIVMLADFDDDMRLRIKDLNGHELRKPASTPQPAANKADDTAILLFTSGTSGTKKLVPLTIHSLICGVAIVVESWGLSSSMRCLNQMPLNHVGGLVRNLFAPIMSGGSVICCQAFDANFFWDCIEDFAPTWYYASPSMHQCILEAAADRSDALEKNQIRLVCNAAGGLLPSLANQLRDTFSSNNKVCTVLPSYGMTECMPISTPPLSYRLDKTGTSGISVGPEIAILDGNDSLLPAGENGRIGVRGAPVFGGYLKLDGTADTSCFTDDGWFDTGDMGYLDKEGYLFINGRSKEVINRGGELISPFEVEEAVMMAANDSNSPIAGKVSKALAFSVKHDVLQEVVGIVLTKHADSKRPSLSQVQTALKPLLSQVKIPSLVVYMDGGLPTNNNKVLRIKLAERLDLPEITDATGHFERHYQAVCPPANTPLTENIACESVSGVNAENIKSQCEVLLPSVVDSHVRVDEKTQQAELLLAPVTALASLDHISTKSLLHQLGEVLEGYHVPAAIQKRSKPFPRLHSGELDEIALSSLLNEPTQSTSSLKDASTQGAIIKIFSEVLSVPAGQLSGSSDFFDAGGDSMKAGRLLSSLRKEFSVRLPIDVLFANSSVSALAVVVDDRLGKSNHKITSASQEQATGELAPGCEKTYSSTNPFLLVLQLTPLMIFWPMRRALTWTIFMYCLSATQRLPTNMTIPGRLLNLVVSMGIGRLITRTITPFLAMAFKWLVIGRYREGLYPMWGWYHTRWWLCEKIIATAGMGVLSYFNWSRVLYLRLMGAKVGKNVTINRGTTLGEYDLITIADGAVLERCKVRPMAPERNTSMYLGRIVIGANSSVGLASIVAPGASVPADACIGPNSSSWEIDDADEANRELASSKIPGAHWALALLLGLPLQTLSAFIRALPWLACLVALVRNEPNTSTTDQVREVIIWFASPDRVGWHYAALAANSMLGPVFLFAAVIAIKSAFDTACGKVQPGLTGSRSQTTTFRMQLIRTLMPAPKLHKLTELFGTHYEATSVFFRALGAKVGKHVYWPGTGPSIQDYDLIEVGDNVVFGSRAHIVTSDGTGSEVVRIKDNAMVADRVVLLPGSELGEKTVMGSGALAKRETHYPANTTWVGSKKNEAICLSRPTIEEKPTPPRDSPVGLAPHPQPLRSAFSSRNSSRIFPSRQTSFDTSTYTGGDAEKQQYHRPGLGSRMHSHDPLVPPPPTDTSPTEDKEKNPTQESDLSPFARAFYHKQAPYRVWTQFEIFLYSTFITVLTAVWWNIGSISSVQIVAALYRSHTPSTSPSSTSNDPLTLDFLAYGTAHRPITLYALFLALIIAIMAVQSIITLAFLVAAKWVLMGRRQPGSYDWDRSPYCQRWQLYLKLESLRRNCYGGNGILGMLTGTHWMVLYFRSLGARIGSDCALFAGGQPSLLFTEPDLLTLGDRISVDDASLVGHINTAGRFNLNPLSVGHRSVLRSGSRLLSGGAMMEDSCLLEHTLVMAGDVVDAGVTMQGWPGEEWRESRTPTLRERRVWRVRE